MCSNFGALALELICLVSAVLSTNHGKTKLERNSVLDFTNAILHGLADAARVSPPTPTSKSELFGKSIQLDFTNKNFQGFMDPSKESSLNAFISDLKSRGIQSVIYMIPDGRENLCLAEDQLCTLQKIILSRLRVENFGIWLMIFGSLFYFDYDNPSTRPSHPDWQTWQVQFLDKTNGPGIATMSMHHPQWVSYQMNRISRIMATGYFDGLHLTESFFPAGPVDRATGKSLHPYADVSPYAIQTKFCREYLSKPKVECDSMDFSKIFTSVTDLYPKWIEFRAETVTNFNKAIKSTVSPQYAFAAWVIDKTCLRPGDCTPDFKTNKLAALKEWYGFDGGKISSTVQPELTVIQTDWPDWSNQDLPANYPTYYTDVFNNIKAARPTQAIGLQADISSCHCQFIWKQRMDCNRGFDSAWFNSLYQNSKNIGYTNVMTYEYWFAFKCGVWANPTFSSVFEKIVVNKAVNLYKGAWEKTPVQQNVYVGTVPLVATLDDGWRKVIVGNVTYWIVI